MQNITRNPVAGLAVFGEVNIPEDILNVKSREISDFLRSINVDLIETGIIQDDPERNDEKRAKELLRANEFDLLIIAIAGWIPSHTVISVTETFKDKPILLWGVSGRVVDGRFLTTAAQAGTSALRAVFEDMEYRYKYVFNTIDGGIPEKEISDFVSAARAVVMLKESRVGMMGYRDMNLYNTLFDGVSLRRVCGVEIEFFEMLEMIQAEEKIKKNDVETVIKKIENEWDISGIFEKRFLIDGIRLYLAIKDKTIERGYDAVSLIDVDGVKKLLNMPPAVVFMLLSDSPGVCTIPENDSLGAVTQLIIKYLTGQAAAYLEFYEYMQDRVLMGVPDFVPGEIVDGKIKATFTKFGKFGKGLLNTSKIKTGRVTIARLASTGDKYKMHVVTGEAVTPRTWCEEGWDPPPSHVPSLEIILDVPVKEFAQKVLGQHYIISYGDNRVLLHDFCKLLGIDEF